MSWPAFLVASLIAVALDGSLLQVLRIGTARPSLLMIVVVYALLSAPKRTALRAALTAGLFADLLTPILANDMTVLVVVGPHILGFALGAFAFLSFRNLLYRKSPIALGFGALVFALLVALGTTSTFVLRTLFGSSAPWGEAGSATEFLLNGLSSAALTAVLAAFMLRWMDRTRALWSFESSARLVGGAAR